MSDPYNTYVDHIPANQVANVPAAPVAPLAPTADRHALMVDLIGRLDVSETWKRRFYIIERAGGADLPNGRHLSFGDRRVVNFNFFAFFFGPFYYLAKGLWRQAILYTLLAVGISLLLELVGMGHATHFLGYGFAAVYAMRANTSYYRKALLDDAPWL